MKIPIGSITVIGGNKHIIYTITDHNITGESILPIIKRPDDITLKDLILSLLFFNGKNNLTLTFSNEELKNWFNNNYR